jgi:hypothetical protein
LEAGDGNLATAEWHRVHRLVAHRLDRVKLKLVEWDSAPEEREDSKSKGLRHWLPALIVLASLAAATMGWQASVADERATTKDELSRQDLVVQQQVELQKIQQIDSDIRLFGQTVQEGYLAGAAQSAAKYSDGQAKRLLAAEASGDTDVATWLDTQIQAPQAVTLKPKLEYNVRTALLSTRSGDPVLTSLEPGTLRAEAQMQRTRGLHLVGLAALFIVALVFFTCAAVTSRAAADGAPTSGSRARNLVRRFRGPEAAAHWFVTMGGIVWLTAFALFWFARGIL